MARGGPDWYDPVRITYGTIASESYDGSIAAPLNVDIIEVKARGIILGGFVYASGFLGNNDDIVRVYIDDAVLSELSFKTLHEQKASRMELAPVFIIQYDDIFYRFGVGILPQTTFGLSFKINYEVKGAFVATVSARTLHAAIE